MATINGRAFRELDQPLREVGALLDAGYVHPGRTARNHLWAMAASNGLPRSRVDEVLAMVGLGDVGGVQLRAYSLGMRQRLGLAGVMLGDPHTLILDEPANGLDPEGIRWIRDFLSYLARQGRTILVSSHALSEMSLMADHLVVIGHGRLIEENSVDGFIARYARQWVNVRSPQLGALAELLQRAGGLLHRPSPDVLQVQNLPVEQIGETAAANAIVLHELSSQSGSLEDAFLQLTRSTQEYRTAPVGTPLPPPEAPR
jgi:ABC-2 type transport system ATP-binding protein